MQVSFIFGPDVFKVKTLQATAKRLRVSVAHGPERMWFGCAVIKSSEALCPDVEE